MVCIKRRHSISSRALIVMYGTPQFPLMTESFRSFRLGIRAKAGVVFNHEELF